MTARRRSTIVKLAFIGAAAATLAGCGDDEVRRDVYANKEDCLADWGNTPQDCEPAYDHPASRGPTTAYYGRPYTYRSGDSSPSHTGRTIGSSTTRPASGSVSRGGFGGSGHSSSG